MTRKAAHSSPPGTPPRGHARLEAAVLRKAETLGRRHGTAAAGWQIGDSGSDAALAFYRDLLRGIAGAGPEITGLYEMPGLTAQQDYDRDNLAADLGLARDDPALAQAAQAYRAAAREHFWLQAAQLARRHLHPGPDHTTTDADEKRQLSARPGPEAGGAQDCAEDDSASVPQDITDPATGLSRLLSRRCSTCILRVVDCT